jgi:hypothetical protein
MTMFDSITITNILNNTYVSAYQILVYNIYKSLLVTDGILPRAYGLPKIHKAGHPFRIIVSTINSSLHYLAIYLHKIIKSSIINQNSFVRDSYDLVKKLKKVKLQNNFQLASFDVVSLFSNVPMDLVTKSIKKKWNKIQCNTIIPLNEFLIGVNTVLNSMFFKFNHTVYKQIFGTPMGSPLSPIITEIVL